MASLISTPGKYRLRKDEWNHPEVSSIEEEQTNLGMSNNRKIPRRITLAFLAGTDKINKRRSSLTVPFIRRIYGSSEKKMNSTAEYFSETGVEEVFKCPNSRSESSLKFIDENAHENQNKCEIDDTEKKMRRTSLQNKLERRRRKGISSLLNDNNVVETETEYRNSNKRNSWWNIFERTRRASQDVGIISKSSDSLPTTYQRSKSRSVDHGLAAPYDLDSLRSKVDDRLNRDDKKVPTIPYTVGDRDSLRAIAARFDTTPSELTALNRLASSFVYPGQQLLVPDKSNLDESIATLETGVNQLRKISSEDLLEEKDILDGLRPASPKPGYIERVSQNSQQLHNDDDPVTIQRFLKINVRHITDGQGVVGGVLLVTPNAVMFDPNVSDPLVIEHGPESYGVIAPMEFIVNAAIFNDIAHMRVGGEATSNEKPEIYHPKALSRCETHSPGKDSLLVKDETFPELGVGSVDVADDQESVCSSNERNEGDAFPKAFERDLITPNSALDRKDKFTEESLQKTKSDVEDDRSIEDRRKSLLDHHWAIPKNSEDENTNQDVDVLPYKQDKTDETLPHDSADDSLMKHSCHDSGIDIRDTSSASIISKQKVYSDADIVLSKDWVPPLTIAPSQLTTSITCSHESQESRSPIPNQELGRKSVNFSIEDNDVVDKTGDNKKSKMLKRLSHPLAWVEGLTGDGNKSQDSVSDSAPNTGDSNQSVFSKVFSRRSSIGTLLQRSNESISASKNQKQQPKLDYRSMVSIDDMPTLFVSFDQLIPRPARACLDPPMYIRLRMGRQFGKTTPLPTTVMSYGKNKLRPEYWFSIPKNKVDELYRFLNSWVPHLYGELDEEAIKARGFELILNETQWDDNADGSNKDGIFIGDGEITEYTRESWEVLSMSTDDYRKAALFTTGSFEQEFQVPDLVGQTEILTEEHREKLCGHLPARAEGYNWSLIFSTSLHGFSLNSLYRKMQKLESPILIVIQDTEHNVFGALTSCSLHVSDHFYGTGESLLYKFNPNFKVFHWSGENLYFIKGNPESLAIGAGDGRFGLWLDGDLNQGRSEHCSTYSNEPLTTQEDFVIKTLECWAFV